MSELADKAQSPPPALPKFDASKYAFSGKAAGIADIRSLSTEDKERLLMSGVDLDLVGRSGSYLQVDDKSVHCDTCDPNVEILDITEALRRYDGLPDYFWNAVKRDQDDFTRMADQEVLQGGYFMRVKAGMKITEPVQSCLFIKGEAVAQNVHNIIVVEEDAELHVITGCATAHNEQSALHLGISEFYVKKGGKLTFTMIHNWGEKVMVRPRTVGIVEEDGEFQSNYVLLKPVESVQSYPSIHLNGPRAVARFNSVIVAPTGSLVDTGNRIFLNAPETRGEIISRTITTGGKIIARGHIIGSHVPAKGHLECKGLILGNGIIHAIPELEGTVSGVELSHEAAVGKIAQEEIEYLMARGLDEDEATSTIVRGFLNVEIMGLPEKLRQTIDKTIQESEKDMF
ncbi:MAG: SufD family Fe-S cluster assembly protein [Desulfovibrionales bacterium]|nr:MAG: SufD family Fe-S cluster assembly protein [Desulfovibrionales bacterium]